MKKITVKILGLVVVSTLMVLMAHIRPILKSVMKTKI